MLGIYLQIIWEVCLTAFNQYILETETLYGQKNIVKTGNHRDSSSTNIIFESSHVQHNTPIPEKTGMKKFECMFR